MNNPTLGLCCEAMIGRADIEGSKSDVAMSAWPPQASYPCGNFSDTSALKLPKNQDKGSLGLAFTVRSRTERSGEMSFYPCVQREISVLTELILGHRRWNIVDVPPQPNSPPDSVGDLGQQDQSQKLISPPIISPPPKKGERQKRIKKILDFFAVLFFKSRKKTDGWKTNFLFFLIKKKIRRN